MATANFTTKPPMLCMERVECFIVHVDKQHSLPLHPNRVTEAPQQGREIEAVTRMSEDDDVYYYGTSFVSYWQDTVISLDTA
jgi:hypothetical protein